MSADPRLNPRQPPEITLVCTGTREKPHRRHILVRVAVGAENVHVLADRTDSAGRRNARSGFPGPGALLDCRFGDFGPTRVSDANLYRLAWAIVETGASEYDVHRDAGTLDLT